MNTIIARKALVEDINGILKLQSHYLYNENISHLNGKTGLLNTEINFNELKHCIESDDCIVIVLENLDTKIISAYALCYSFSSIVNTKQKLIQVLQNNSYLQINRNALLLEHIVIQNKKGVMKLLKALYDEAKYKYNDIYGEIMSFPIENTVSKKFFTILRGNNIGSIEYEDNTVWDIYYSPIQKNFIRNS
jgi:hypothetical protein